MQMQACLAATLPALPADSGSLMHTRNTPAGAEREKRLASIAYADPLHRTWFEVAQTSICCIGRVAAGLAGRPHTVQLGPQAIHPSRGSDLTGTND